jgi:uncharacterized protein YdaU (DUF1376 family)
MTDLTRFDFRALRFLKSENVEGMTAEEVGEFVLLMCHAWLGGKNASLPNNPALLARYARCERVSEVVMREWKKGPDGRLYNETLSEEWSAAVGRSAHGSRAAALRWSGKKSPTNSQEDAPVMPEQCPSNAPTGEGALPKPNQPSQSKTVSSEPNGSDEQVLNPKHAKEPSCEGIELAKLLRKRITENNPKAKVTDTQERKWAFDADRMMRLDGRTPAEICDLIEFSQADSFWLHNILSMGKLREQFAALWIRFKGPAKPVAVKSGPFPQRKAPNGLNDDGRKIYEQAGVSV